MKKLKFAIVLVTAFAWTIGAFAQPGLDEMHQAVRELRSTYFSAVDCCLVLAAIFGITGAVRVYHSWQMGKREITADISAWFYASVFMVLAGVFLQALFGI